MPFSYYSSILRIKMESKKSIIVLGKSGVGKTCLITRYCKNDFKECKPTDKVEQLTKTNGKCIIHDTPGGYIINPDYLSKEKIEYALLMYDITNRDSFDAIVNYARDIKTISIYKRIIVGNKCDVDAAERKVTYEEGFELAQSLGYAFSEASAKENIEASSAFEYLTRDVNPQIQVILFDL